MSHEQEIAALKRARVVIEDSFGRLIAADVLAHYPSAVQIEHLYRLDTEVKALEASRDEADQALRAARKRIAFEAGQAARIGRRAAKLEAALRRVAAEARRLQGATW